MVTDDPDSSVGMNNDKYGIIIPLQNPGNPENVENEDDDESLDIEPVRRSTPVKQKPK